ncbi:MAG: aminoacyl-tRNA hydrolase [Pegethrix bostrychoides GSE-TBD4-15B]|jgi:PTH1 family peptidyl-tRNA hydrolase|uniref:Peptidyl-tRNA hydrolase n=1 Tax=Pegethrix bostrychoides GSE-TBD4-15B TaxID=2839662 RepID=A0A951P7U4_9CYAN|nr:aminoacyl-tRNA hydrolase [Pegethrix bostrychoides GSE-TBD4-15B]
MTNSAASSETPIQLIVGLGNPGAKYDQTRHNIGFEALDLLSRSWRIPLSEHRKFQGQFGEGMAVSRKLRLLKPTTFMNLSGQSIRAVTDWYKLPPESVLVIYDDMDLPIGKLRLRQSGSAGGHNGIKSAIAHLHSQNFPRLRIGIGSAKQNVKQAEGEVISHVLGRFSQAESKAMSEMLKLVVDAVEMSLKQGIPKAMSLYNNRSIEAPGSV